MAPITAPRAELTMDEELKYLTKILADLVEPAHEYKPGPNEYRTASEVQRRLRNYLAARKLFEEGNLKACVTAAKANMAQRDMPRFLMILNLMLLYLSVEDLEEAMGHLIRAGDLHIGATSANPNASRRAREALGWARWAIDEMWAHWNKEWKRAREGNAKGTTEGVTEGKTEVETEVKTVVKTEGKDMKGEAHDVVTVKKAAEEALDAITVVKVQGEEEDAVLVEKAEKEADDPVFVEKADGQDPDENEDGFVEIDELYI